MLLEVTKRQIEMEYDRFMLRLTEPGGRIVKKAEEISKKIGREKRGGSGENTVLLLKYLYANMPLSDVVNYPYETFYAFARHGALLMREGVWKIAEEEDSRRKEERLFLDYVVYHRVNTEGITPCRKLFYEKVKERLTGKTVKNAILEVNYWCAEEVTYRCSDDRTLSAEAVYRSGIGRCGEESVFTVNVLRSVGIPARQVYAQRWSHCDDNHAWVEAWCDGKWRYLGACEPEETLDKGWFTGAASRAMMISSQVYGSQKPDGEIVMQEGMTTAVSELERYALTAQLLVRVVDESGRAVPGAQVSCEVLNYARLVPVISGKTGSKGEFRAQTGLGSLMIHARSEDLEGSVVARVERDGEVIVAVAREDPFYSAGGWISFDMAAPGENPKLYGHAAKRNKADGEKKIRALKRYRHKMRTSEGNDAQIRRFLEKMPGDDRWKRIMVENLAEKDLRDCTAEILYDHFHEAMKWKDSVPENLFRAYVLAPRIGLEQPSAYRSVIKACFTEEEEERFRRDPGQIRNWIRSHIREMEEKEYPKLITLPEGMLEYGYGSGRSQEILFAAICRTFGIPARLDPVEEKARVMGERSPRTAFIRFRQTGETAWLYGENWSVSKKTEKGWRSLRLGSGSGEYDFAWLSPGRYRVITTNRLPGGDQFAAVCTFDVEGESEYVIDLMMRQAETSDLLMNADLEDFALSDESGAVRTAAGEIAENGEMIFIWIERDKEPAEHILNEIREKEEAFHSLGGRLCFVLKDCKDLGSPTFSRTVAALPKAGVLFDPERKVQRQLARRMYKDPEALPFLLAVDRTLTGVYAESGYNVGTGDMLLRIMRAVSKE